MTAATVPAMPLDEDTARELSRAAKQAVTWTERRNKLIREAVEAGAGVREVGRAVGLSHAAVINILRPRKRGGPNRASTTASDYPGDEPCACGAVVLTGHYLSEHVEGEPDVSHYRRSSVDPCEEKP